MSIQNTKYLCTNKKGYTLVELMVAITIFVIVLGVTATIILSSQNIFKGNANVTLGKQVGESIISFIEDEIQYATAININQSQDVDENYTNALYFQNGRIFYLNNEVFTDLYGDGFYNSFEIQAFINIDNINLTNLSVFVFDAKGEEIYSTSTIISFKNHQFNQSGFVFTPNGEIDLQEFTLYYTK